MRQLLSIFPLLWHARRPNRTADMTARACPFWVRKGYEAVTFFGTILTHTVEEADMLNRQYDALKHHEMIHLYQARSTGNSWLLFYLRYGWYYLQASRYWRRLRNAGYHLNPFEMEAYAHMYDLHYLEANGNKAEGWRQYARMTLKERMETYLRHYQ